eukprot:208250_1
MNQLYLVQNKLKGFKGNLVEPHRKYINQFTFNYKFHKKLKLMQFCVFSDTIIITNNKWKVMDKIEMRIINIQKINDKNGKGFELKYLKNKQIYYDTNENINNYINEIYNIIKNEQLILEKNDLSLFNAGCNTMKGELKRIAIEVDEQKKKYVN